MRELAGGKPVGIKLCVGAPGGRARHLQGHAGRGHGPRLHRRRRQGGRHRRGPAGVLRPRRHAAHRGPDGRAQRAGRGRVCGTRSEDRRGGQGGHRLRHRQAAHPGRGLHQRRPGDDDGDRLHPEPALPHQPLPGRGGDAGPAAGAGARRRRQEPTACSATSEATVAQAVQIMASMGCASPAELAPHQLDAPRRHTDTRSYASCSTGWSPASCSPSRRGAGPPTGRPPTPTAGSRYRAQNAWMSCSVAQ